MGADNPLLEIKGLYAGIEGNEILKGIDLEIGAGEIHAIMGRNGSGKTTTANVIMGHPDFEVEKGEVILEGINASGQWVGINDTPTIEHYSMQFLQKLDL